MFFVLSVVENKGGIKGRLSDLIHPPSVTVQKVQLKAGSAFYKVTAVKHRRKVPWKEIEKVCGKLSTRAVLPHGIIPDEGSLIKSYVPVVLPFRILFNSAVTVIKKLDLDPVGVSVTVFDENAHVTDLVEKLVPFCSTVRIITSCLDIYEKLASRLLMQYGISLIIRPKVDDSILSSTMIICDKSDKVPFTFRGILFTNQKRRMLGSLVISGSRITLPEKYELPENDDIATLTYASALYELCGINELDMLIYDDIKS